MERQNESFYLSPLGIPKVVFSHVYTTENYDISLGEKENFIEITYFERGITTVCYPNGDKIVVPERSCFINLYDTPLRFYSNGLHTHYTVAFELNYEKALLPRDNRFFRLDKTTTNSEFVLQASEIIKKCVQTVLKPNKSPLELSSFILQLFALYQKHDHLTSASENKGNSLTIKYVREAEKYILSHIHENFTVSDIADHLMISSGYLSNIFRKTTGTTIVKYKNKVKLEIIKNLVYNESSTLAEACASCGITDPNYVSRMFKKYTDFTLTEIKNNPQNSR